MQDESKQSQDNFKSSHNGMTHELVWKLNLCFYAVIFKILTCTCDLRSKMKLFICSRTMEDIWTLPPIFCDIKEHFTYF